MENSYRYKNESGLLEINTLSPSSAFYYRIQTPVALNPSAFGCKIAFFDIHNDLLYHRRHCFAHELHSVDDIREIRKQTFSFGVNSNSQIVGNSRVIINWSEQGNAAYMLEFYKTKSNMFYESVILYLSKKYCYRIIENGTDFSLVNELKIIDRPFDEKKVEDRFVELGMKAQPMYLDSVRQGIFVRKWHPTICKPNS